MDSYSPRTIQIVAGAMLFAPVPILIVFAVIPPIEALGVLLFPAFFLGLVALFTGFFLHRQLVYARRPGADRTERLYRFFQGTILPLALTEAAALLGVLAYSGVSEVWAWFPLICHILLGVYVWPSQAKFDRIVGTPKNGSAPAR